MSEYEHYFNRLGMPVEMMEWAREFEGENRIIKQTRHKENGKEFWLSTVFLGLNHNFSREGPPLIYETMALVYKPRWNEVVASREEWEWQERYTTEDEALEARDPWRVVTTYKPDIISVFVKALKGEKIVTPTKRWTRILSRLRRS